MDYATAVLTEFVRRLPDGIRVDGMRFLIGTGVVFLVVWVMLGRALADRRIRPALPARLRNKQILREFRNAFITIVVFTFSYTLVEYTLEEALGLDVFKRYRDVSDFGWIYFFASIGLWVLGHDAYFYWTHRMMHHPRLYRTFHLEHHRSHKTTPFTAYSFAPPEAILMYLYVPLFDLLVPLHQTAFVICMFTMMFRNAIAHCAYEIFPRGTARHPIGGLSTTVTHHDMHHERGTGNFGFYFSFWDKWMGTEHSDYLDRFDRASGARDAMAPDETPGPAVTG